jgi:histone H3/H4
MPAQQPLPPPTADASSAITKKKRRGSSKKDFDALMRGKRQGQKAILCIPKATFRRLVEEIAAECKSDLRIQQDAVDTLQEDAELLIIERFKRCSRLAEICRKDTIRDEHWNFVREDEGSLALPYSGRS